MRHRAGLTRPLPHIDNDVIALRLDIVYCDRHELERKIESVPDIFVTNYSQTSGSAKYLPPARLTRLESRLAEYEATRLLKAVIYSLGFFIV